MLVVSGPEPSFCLLLLLLLGPYSSAGASPPHRRFEYKLSFKGPRLALPGAGVPFWSHQGDAMLGLEEVRLVPSMQNRSGAVWNRVPVFFSAWKVEAMWYTRDRGQVFSVLEGPTWWDGIGILFDSPAEDTQNSPAVRGLASDGHTHYEARGDGAGGELGAYHWDFRNLPYPSKVRITYWGQPLRVSLNSGLSLSDLEEVCVDIGPLLLAPGGFFGVSAATSTLADDHDILSFLTFSLSEPSPKPFLEMEELRLAKQLEGLWARLALGTKKHMIPQRSSEVQEEGERSFVLAETLGRHHQTLQALQDLSAQLAQAERQWKKQLGSLGHARPMGAWDAAAHVASRAQLFYLPVGTKHHFLELNQVLSLLQKDLQGPLKAASKNPHPPGQLPGASSCLRPRMFLFFLLIQTVGFFCYVYSVGRSWTRVFGTVCPQADLCVLDHETLGPWGF